MPSTTAAEEKGQLRARLTAVERALTPEQLRQSDEALFRRLTALPEFIRAERLFLFVGMGAEPDTLPLIQALAAQGKTVFLPRCLPGRGMACLHYDPEVPLVRHRYGMLEPPADAEEAAPDSIDLTLVPALCYDRRGVRLGRGGGYYDRWLAGFSGRTVGLCRGVLLQDVLPREPHDLPVERVVTEDGVVFSL